MIYADTSFVVSHFVQDANTLAARELIPRLSSPLLFSPLVRLEYQTAIWQKVARSEFHPAHAKRSIDEWETQIRLGFFEIRTPAAERVWQRAMALSEAFTVRYKLRSLDIWHVSFALEAGANGFWTFDQRQRDLAAAVGLVVNG